MHNCIFKKIALLLFLTAPLWGSAQKDTITPKLSFEADFRFRIEQDWNSRQSDGAFRADRTRLRYRVRAGLTYKHNHWATVGMRIRTGDPRKQQDPQLTLGQGWGEFSTLPIGLEKAYFQAKGKSSTLWFGKNQFPFAKQNELFWSDNVYPEGVFAQKSFFLDGQAFSNLKINLGHFIINHQGKSFKEDTYMQALQFEMRFANRVHFFPGIFLFKNIQSIPDNHNSYRIDYAITNMGTTICFNKELNINLELEFLQNIIDYSKNDSIPTNLKNQKKGWNIALNYGKLEEKKDWQFKLTYSYLERYAAVDFLTQNDWARWDYSAYDSPDGRLTNLQGIEAVAQYNIQKNMSLTIKYYKVAQIIRYGSHRETGDRIRLDFDIKF